MEKPPVRRRSGRPHVKVLRVVDPPVSVLVDLGALFAPPPHYKSHFVGGGLQVGAVVTGSLRMWAIGESTGAWYGLVSYELAIGPESGRVTHWIPSWFLERV